MHTLDQNGNEVPVRVAMGDLNSLEVPLQANYLLPVTAIEID